MEARSVVTIRKGNTKGDEATRQIDTHPKIKALLEGYVPGDRHVFPGRHRHNGSINPRSADEILKAACDRVKIEGVTALLGLMSHPETPRFLARQRLSGFHCTP